MAGKESCGGEASPGKKGFGGSGGDMKKGPWTSQEDEILTEYVKKHGEGNWNAVQKNSGLLRCGKSCRLRWANHLRPNLKKGAFSPEEEKIIIELHAKLGNKWARMAAQLPGRTDNEIKNYWNTRLKRRQRAGLPINPRDVEKEAVEELRPKRLKSSSSSFETFLSPAPEQQKPNCTSSLSVFADPINFSGLNQLNSVFFSKSNPQFRVYPETKNYAMPVSPVSPFLASSSSSAVFNQNVHNQVITVPSVQFNSITFNNNVALNPMIVGGSIEGLKWGSSNGDDEYVMGAQSLWGGNGGLLDALLQEEYKEEVGKQMIDNLAEEDAQQVESAEKQRDALSSSQSSIGMKGSEDQMEEMNSMDEDLQSLLNNFPSSIQIPVPEWYNGSSRQSSNTDDALLQTHQNANSTAPVQTASASVPDLNWSLGSCCWNNMPGIC